MQDALRSALAELARGLSTGAVVLAGSPRCPACQPTLSCEAPPRCPDCVCYAGERGSLASPPSAISVFLLSLVIVLVFVSGGLIGYIYGRRHRTIIELQGSGKKGSRGIWLTNGRGSGSAAGGTSSDTAGRL